MANPQPGQGKKKKKTPTRKTTARSTKTASKSAKKKTTTKAKKTTGNKRVSPVVRGAAAVADLPPIVSWQRRQEMIAEAAYYKAEKRGFAAGDATADWKEAEAEIDALLAIRER